LFGGADVEMVLMAADGPVHYVGDENGVGRQRVAPDVLDRDWVIRALGGSNIQTGVDDGRGYCSAVLGGGDAPLAVLIARRQHGSSGFRSARGHAGRGACAAGRVVAVVAELAKSRDAALARPRRRRTRPALSGPWRHTLHRTHRVA